MKKYILFLIILFPLNTYSQAVWDGGGDGLTWEDPLNWASNSLPTNSDKVAIVSATVKVNSTVNIAELKVDQVQFTIEVGAKLSILTAPLSIGFTDAFSITNGSFLNKGDLEISSSGATNGLVLKSSIAENRTGAFINIISSKDTSIIIYPTSKLTNQTNAQIKLNGATKVGLWNKNIFINQGTVNIQNTANGILNIDSTANQGTINSINITGEYALKNEFFFQNNGIIKHQDSNNKGIWNEKNFINTTSGIIQIDTAQSAILNTNYFKNDGEIYITRAAICIENNDATEVFRNNGKIDMYYIFSYGIKNKGTADSSIFTSGPNAELYMNTSPIADGFVGIKNESKARLRVDGTAELKRCEPYAIHNLAVFRNAAAMTLDSIAKEGIYNESGTFTNQNGGILILKNQLSSLFSELRNDASFINEGNLNIEHPISNQSNKPMIRNNSVFTNTGSQTIRGNGFANGIENIGTLSNAGSIKIKKVAAFGLINTNSFINNTGALFRIDTLKGPSGQYGIYSNHTFNNSGKIHISNSDYLALLFDNSTNDALNSGEIRIDSTFNTALKLQGTGKKVINQVGGRIIIDSTSNTFDAFGIDLAAGTVLQNQGFIQTSRTKFSGLNAVSASILNEDSLIIKKAYPFDAANLDNSTFDNKSNGYLGLNGSGAENLRLLNVPVGSSLINAGRIELIDAYSRGIYVLGSLNSLINSNLQFTNNTRNTSSLIEVGSTNPTIYMGNMSSINSKNCVNFQGVAENHGFLDLRNCLNSSINMVSGTNKLGGRILSGAVSLIQNNEGIFEFYSPTQIIISGVNTITNTGIIIDKMDALRNIRFNDGGALGFPIWNKGLFVSPFYGVLSNGIKETVNLNYTETGTLPITTDWYTDRAKTQVAGTWEQNLHEFTPNINADAADSLFFEVNMTGSNAIVLSIPHKKPTACPNPKIIKTYRTNLIYNWNKHTTWRGNRAPDYCQEVLIGGHEATIIESGYKAKVNFINYTPQSGAGRFFEVQYGAVMEINALPYE